MASNGFDIPANTPLPSWWIGDTLPCMMRQLRITSPPNVWPMHWCPRQTPKIGVVGANRVSTSFEMPASFGVHGPGEMMMCVGFSSAIWSSVIWSLRTTSIGSVGSISPNRWTRL